MERMKKFCSIALAALALGAICLPPAEAAYKPKITSKMGGQAIKDVQKAVTTLKAMPKPLRWTFFAESMGLLFMPPNGRIGHKDDGNILDGSISSAQMVWSMTRCLNSSQYRGTHGVFVAT